MDLEGKSPHAGSDSRGSVRIGVIRISPFWVGLALLIRLTPFCPGNANKILVRCTSLVAQMLSSIVLMSDSSDSYIPLGAISFVLGVIEAGVEFWRL